MKDPLHKDPTPWEILGVPPAAQRREVEIAFANALRNRMPPNKAQYARDVLVRPERKLERVFFEMLQYNEEYLRRLHPSPAEDETVLDPENRLKTATKWESQMKGSFPDMEIAHCQAVLWYWWTIYEEGRQEEMLENSSHSELERMRSKENEKSGGELDCRSFAPPLDDMWRRSIAYWSMIAADSGLWNGRLGLSQSEVAEMRKKIREDLHNRLTALKQQCNQKLGSGNFLATRYRQLEVNLHSEMKSAKVVAESGYKTKQGPLCAGVQMLRFLGLLEGIRSSVDGQLNKNPNDSTYKRLRYVLSEYFEIEELLDHFNSPDEGLQHIAALPEEKRKHERVKYLQGRAYVLKARQSANAGDAYADEALEYYGKSVDAYKALEAEKAIASGVNKETLIEELAEEISQLCISKAEQGRRTDNIEQAIEILEKGVKLVNDEKMKRTLADLLTDKAIAAANKALEDLKDLQAKPEKFRAALEEVQSVLKLAVNDLERAAELGSRRAEENLLVLRDHLRYIEEILDPNGRLPPDPKPPDPIERLLKEAYDAFKRGDYDKAIENLQKAKELLGQKTPDHLNKFLASCLTSRGIKNANSAIKIFYKKKENLYENLINNHNSWNCANCAKPRDYNVFLKWYELKLGNSKILVCENCLSKIEKIDKTPPRPTKVSIWLLKSAEKDLVEAMALDPENSKIKESLKYIRNNIPKKPKVMTAMTAILSKTLWIFWFILVLIVVFYMLSHR